MIHGTRGGVVGADIPMFLGAMAMGPLGGWVIKKFDSLMDGKIPGFEMLINNFSSGILGGILAIIGFMAISPIAEAINIAMGASLCQ